MDRADTISSSEISELFKLLSHPMRVKIIDILEGGGTSYTTLLERLDNPSTGTLNFHLKKLEPLLEKEENDLYKLNTLGEKALQLIDQYKEERKEHGTPRLQLAKRNSPWRAFIELPSGYMPMIFSTIFMIISIISFLSLSTGNPPNLLHYGMLLVGSSIGLTFMVEKMYHANRPLSVLLLGLISFTATWMMYTLIFRVGIRSDGIFFLVYTILFGFSVIPDFDFIGNNLTEVTLETIREIYPISYTWNLDLLIIILSGIIALGVGYYRYGELVSLQGYENTLKKQDAVKVEAVTDDVLSWKHGLVHVILVGLSWLAMSQLFTLFQRNNPSSFLFLQIEGKLMVTFLLTGSYVVAALVVAKLFNTELHQLGRVDYQMGILPLVVFLQPLGFDERRINLIRLRAVPGVEVISDYRLDYEMSYLDDFLGFSNTDFPALQMIVFLGLLVTAILHYSYHKVSTDDGFGRINSPVWPFLLVVVSIISIIYVSFPKIAVIEGSEFSTTYLTSPSNMSVLLFVIISFGLIVGQIAYKLGKRKKVFGYLVLAFPFVIAIGLVIETFTIQETFIFNNISNTLILIFATITAYKR